MLGGGLKQHEDFVDYDSVVDYDTARKIEKLGIPWQTELEKSLKYHYYNCNGELDGDCLEQIKAISALKNGEITDKEFSKYDNVIAPTYNQMIIFFYRNGLFITITPRRFKDRMEWWWEITDLFGEYLDSMSTGRKGYFNTFYEAIDDCINSAISYYQDYIERNFA